jgi:hypothetical protein
LQQYITGGGSANGEEGGSGGGGPGSSIIIAWYVKTVINNETFKFYSQDLNEAKYVS